MNRLSQKALRVVATLTAVATILSLSGFAVLAPLGTSAAVPSDYGLTEGNTISAAGSSDPDVYIVNDWGYKRLFLNPVIFGMYAHLGGFANVKNVTATARDAFPTSGLFRVDGTEKVYGVEVNGEDTAVLHWVNTSGAQAVADDSNFFKKVFVINQTEFNWYNKGSDYTSVNQVPNYARVPGSTPTPVAGNLSVSLASDTPGATTVTTNAQGVNYLKFRLSGTGTVNTITIKRTSAGSVNDFDNVYLYEGAKRLVDGKSLTSSTGEVTFNMGSFTVSGTRDLTVVGDLSATAGNVDSFQVTAMGLYAGSVSGLPISGNNITVSGAVSGTLTQTKVGSIASPNAGAANVQLSEFKLAADTEAASIKRMQVLQGGTVKPSDLTNLRLTTGTNSWSGTIDSAGKIVFDMGSGFTIAKGNNAIFKIYGDVAGKKAETVALYFESVTDILAIGDQYGFGVAVTLSTSLDDATNTHVLTLQGGILTVTFNGPTASDIGTATDDTVFLKYTMAAASNIEVKKTRLMLSLDLAGDGTWDDLGAASMSSGFSDLDDIKIVNEDTNTVVAGPVDGSSFITDLATGNPSGTSATLYQFTDTFDMSAGQTMKFKVTADLKTANTRTGTDIEANSKVAISLENYADADYLGVSYLKYAGTTTALAATDIVPNANIHGATMTVKSSSLTLGLSANPADSTAVKGQQNVEAVGITFTAANASALKVTDITLTGYSDADGADAFDAGSAGDIGSMVASVALYEKESGTVIATSPSANNLAATAGTLVYNNLNWNIPAGQTKTLLVKANLLNLAAPTKHYFGFDIVNTTDVTAVDSSNNTVNAANEDRNGGASITTAVNVVDAGYLFVTEHDDSPSKQKNSLYWGQTGVTVSQFKLRSTNEAFLVDKITVDSADATDAKNNVAAVYLQYKNEAGTTVTTSAQPLDSNASTSFSFSGTNRPYVPKDLYTVVSVKIDTIGTYAAGATSGQDFAMNFDGSAAAAFEATGAGSMAKVYGSDTTNDDTNEFAMTNKNYIYRSFPKFTVVSMPDGATSGSSIIGKFDITAMGGEVKFGTTAAASGSLLFDTLSSGSLATAINATLYEDASNTILDTASLGSAANNASLSFNSFGNSLTIAAGGTKRIRVEADLSSFNDPVNTSSGLGADYFQLILQDQTAVVTWVDGAGSDTVGDASNVAGYLSTLPAKGPYLQAN